MNVSSVMCDARRKELLFQLVATHDIDALLKYTRNAFEPCVHDNNDNFLEKWKLIIQCKDTYDAATAINQYLVPKELSIEFLAPKSLEIELFQSIAGVIPIITTKNTFDFESIIRNAIYKSRDVLNITDMGAMFTFGKHTRFIVLSNKPYANIPAKQMGLEEDEWNEKSLTIRKHHECAHYYTKQFYGSSKNNLHDELIADFCGFYAAFGEFKAEWFLRCMGLHDNSDDSFGRIQIYTQGLNKNAVRVVQNLAAIVAKGVEEWWKSSRFSASCETEYIQVLCKKELLSYYEEN